MTSALRVALGVFDGLLLLIAALLLVAGVVLPAIYAGALGVLLFVGLWSVRKRVTVPGQLFWVFVVLYALIRVPLDFTRAYEAFRKTRDAQP